MNDDDAVVSFPKKPRCPSPGEVERRLDELEDCLAQTQNATVQVMRSASDAHVALVDACRRQQAMIDELVRRLAFLEHALAVANGDTPGWRRILASAGSPPRKPPGGGLGDDSSLPTVGGEVDIALITPFHGYRWIRQKAIGQLLGG